MNATSIIKRTPLHEAAQFGFYDVAKLLLEHKANLDIRETTTNNTPAELASLHKHDEVSLANMLITQMTIYFIRLYAIFKFIKFHVSDYSSLNAFFYNNFCTCNFLHQICMAKLNFLRALIFEYYIKCVYACLLFPAGL